MKEIFFGFVFLTLSFVNIFAQNKEARKFDELESFYTCEDVRNRVDSFMSELQNQPLARGYIIVYDGNYRFIKDTKYFFHLNALPESEKWKSNLPVIGETVFRSQQILKHINARQFPKQRILLISGGYRKHHAIEFWIVPSGIMLPKPSPTIQEIKYRKGKVEGIICEAA